MAIPDYQSLMLPLLLSMGDGQEYSLRESIDILAAQFSLTETERRELLPSGQQSIFENRVGWARTHLKKAGLVSYPRRGYCQITDRGRQVLQCPPPSISNKYLQQFEEYQQFKGTSRRAMARTMVPDELAEVSTQTPKEILETAYQKLRQNLVEEILEAIRGCSPTFFEKLVIDLLLSMGYGGSRQDAGQRVGRSGDGGIDGIIKEDRLGLDVIYVQAKRWENTVGRPEVQKFAGALLGQQAKKGILITTSQFSREAMDYVSAIDSRIILIDGNALGEYAIDYGVGTSTLETYTIKKIDSDYFTE